MLFVSGSAERDLDLRVPGGRTDFLQKPFDVFELVERVRRLLDADVGPDVPPGRRTTDLRVMPGRMPVIAECVGAGTMGAGRTNRDRDGGG